MRARIGCRRTGNLFIERLAGSSGRWPPSAYTRKELLRLAGRFEYESSLPRPVQGGGL
jgi:hypothetical protein